MSVGGRVDERAVAEMWERQAFDHAALASRGLRVLFRGLPSDAGGPDYQDALLIRDGRELVEGDVEFHVRASDWYTHRHHLDPRYDRVILHVVWVDDGRGTLTASGEQVPTLPLCPAEPKVSFLPRPALLGHHCIAAFAALSTEEVRERVIAAGLTRFSERTARFAADLCAIDTDQVLYTALLEALGYASNRRSFRDLAEAVPYAWLAEVPNHQRLDVLLDASGLGPLGPISPPARLDPDAWRLTRLRPANHPVRRLRGIVDLLNRLGARPADRLLRLLDGGPKPAVLRAALMAHEGDAGLIGAGRADEIAVSAVLPFLAALRPDESRAESLYRAYPAPPANRWTRLMCGLLADAGHPFKVRKAPEHQGLHHLYHNGCRWEGKPGCPICGRG